MPRKGAFIPITDTKTNKSYMMPWDDVTTKPTDQQIEGFVYDQENPSFLSRVTKPLLTPLAHIGKPLDDIGERALQYGEGNDNINIPRPQQFRRPGQSSVSVNGADLAPSPMDVAPWARPMDRAGARVGGAFAQSLGEQVDSLASPAGIALTAAGPVGKGMQMTGLPGLARAGTALTYLPKATGAAQAGAGAIGLGEALYNPSGRGTLEDIKDPLLNIGLGSLGMFGSRSQYKPRAIEPEILPPGSRNLPPASQQLRLGAGHTIEGSVVDYPAPPPPPPRLGRGPTHYVDPQGVAMPDIGDALTEEIKGNYTPKPAGPGYVAPQPRPIASALGDLSRRAPNVGDAQIPDISDAIRRPPAVTPEDIGPLNSPPKYHSVASGKEVFNMEPPVSTAEDAFRAAQEQRGARRTQRNMQAGEYLNRGTAGTRGRDMLNKLITSETGELNLGDLDVQGLIDKGRAGFGKVKGAVSDARQKALQNMADAEATGVFGPATKTVGNIRKTAAALTGPDITNASISGFTRSGWADLESMGDPGIKLSRLLKRARQDTSREIAAARKAGTQVFDEKGLPINRPGGLIWDRNKTQIKTLLSQIDGKENQAKARSIIDTYTGQVKNPTKAYDRGIQSIKAIEALTKLSQFTIGNTAGMGMTATRNSLGNIGRATYKTLTDFKGAFAEAQQSGMLDKLDSAARSDMGEGGISKLMDKAYGISGSENRIRTIATLAGKETAKDLFTKLKANPNNKRLFKQLDDLLLEEDMGSVLKQKELTPDQVNRAGGRMNELTQGTAESIDLPQLWAGHPMMDLMTQFKKFGFMQTRNIKEAFKANPVRTTAVLATVFPALGELIGDTKSTIKGTVKGALGADDTKGVSDAIAKELKNRGSGADRYFTDMGQAWAFGLFDDLRRGIERGPMGAVETVAGPALGDMSEALYGGYKLASEGQGYHLGRQATRAIPYVGTAASSAIQGSYAGSQGRKQRKQRRASRN